MLQIKNRQRHQNSACLTDKVEGLCVCVRERETKFTCIKSDEGTVCHFLKNRIKLLMHDLEKPQSAPK